MLTLTCERAARLLSDALERAMTRRERLLLGLHLRLCDACARYGAHLLVLRAALRRRARSEGQTDAAAPALAADARERLRLRLRRESPCGRDEFEDGGDIK